ncbi:MAG: Holliday junction resolvase RecU [Desulfobacteria bacterium]
MVLRLTAAEAASLGMATERVVPLQRKRPKRTGWANLGKSLEDIIGAANNRYEQAGIAKVTKVAVPIIHLRDRSPDSPFLATYGRKSTVDFQGFIARRGDRPAVPIAFEAKFTRGKRWPTDDDRFPAHEKDFLRLYETWGGLGFVVVEFASVGQIFRVPIGAVSSAPSMSLQEVRRVGTLLSLGGPYFMDYLIGLRG